MKALVFLLCFTNCVSLKSQVNDSGVWEDTLSAEKLQPAILANLDSFPAASIDTLDDPKCLIIEENLIAVQKNGKWLLYSFADDGGYLSIQPMDFDGKGQKELLIIVSSVEEDHGMHGGFREEHESTYLINIEKNEIL